MDILIIKATSKETIELICNYLDLTPIRPRAENWFEVGGIGGIPALCAGEGGLPLLSDPSFFNALFKL